MNPLKSPYFFVSSGMAFHYCAGCNDIHGIAFGDRFHEKIRWKFNKDFEKATFSPSVRHRIGRDKKICHYFIRNGNIEYCGDCFHHLSGKTVPLPVIPDEWLKYMPKVADDEKK